jgi:beta-lactamase regulating signal transducer with metallopeptidase domain
MVHWTTWLLFGIAWKSTVFLLAAYLIDFCFLRRRPLAADTLWSAVFLVLAALPLFVALLPSAALRVSILSSAPITPRSTTLAGGVEALPLIPPPQMPAEAAHFGNIPAERISPHVQPTPSPTQLDWRVLIVFSYISIASWLLLRIVLSFRASLELRRIAMLVPSEAWTERLKLNQQRLAIHRPVELLHSHQVVVPFTMGWRRPCILVPTSMIAGKSLTVIDATLIHELSHLARRDYPVFLASQVIRCLYWFNPLAWIAVRRLNEVREIVCDCYAVSLLADRGGYVGVLLELARSLPDRPRAVLGLAMARTNRLEKRLVAISFCSVRRSASSPHVRLLAAIFATTFAIVTSLTSIHAETASSPADAEASVEISESPTKEDAALDVLPSDAPENVELANQLIEAQKAVAGFKRIDFVEEGVADDVRPKADAAREIYDGLRNEVLRRRHSRPISSDPANGNYELFFDGVTSFVELPTVKYKGEMPYTIEAIISPEPVTGFRVNPELHSYAHYMAIVTDTEFGGIELGLYPNALSFEARSSYSGMYETVEHPCLPFVESRMQVAAVIEDGEIRLYANGKLVGTSPFTGPVKESPFSMRIGCSPHPVTECHDMFRGRIDEVRLSEAALYSEDYDASDQLTADESTVALYHFDEGEGVTVKDASGNGNDGIIHDARWSPVAN